jgi:ribonuclease Z
MTKLIVLGSSNAIPSLENENTHLLIQGNEHIVLVDCASNPIVRLEKIGLDINRVTDIIITHFHPDHVAGIPLLLMDMWLLGRSTPLTIYGLHHSIDRTETMMGLFSWSEWPNFFPVNFCRIPADEMAIVMDNPEMRVYATPVKHFIPNIGLRFEFKPQGSSFAYSCDTEPCSTLFRLAHNVDILLHEAAGAFTGHSSAAQAADVARTANVGELILIHYPSGKFASGDLVAEAAHKFEGPIRKAVDFMQINL